MNEIFTDLRLVELLLGVLSTFIWWKLNKFDRALEELKEHKLRCAQQYAYDDDLKRLEDSVVRRFEEADRKMEAIRNDRKM